MIVADVGRPHNLTLTLSFTSPQAARYLNENVRLLRQATDYLDSRCGLARTPTEPAVVRLAESHGFTPTDLAIVSFITERKPITAICAPTRIWRQADRNRALFRLRLSALMIDVRCILVPASWLKAASRASAARIIARAGKVRVAPGDRDTVLQHLLEEGGGTLASCAEALGDHLDPFSVVLGLDATGYLAVDRSRPLTALSAVSCVSSNR